MASDVLVFIPAFWFAGLLRNEVSSVTLDWLNVVQVAGIAVIAFLIVSYFLHLHRDRYRVGSFDEILALGFAWGISGVVAGVTNVVAFDPRTPTSIFGVGMMLVGVWMLTTRACWR